MRAPAASERHVDGVHTPRDRPREGWKAELALRFARRSRGTVLAKREHRGPLTVQRPFYPEGEDVCHTYVLHPPGGIVGGDELSLRFDLDEGAHALVTTPAATRWYFSRGVDAHLQQNATVADGATLEWLPQETLIFDGAHACLSTRIHLRGNARFCGWELLGFGRPACGEYFHNGRIDFRFELLRDGEPLLLERFRFEGGELPGLLGRTAWATFLAVPAGERELEAARSALEESGGSVCGATLIGDVLVARALAARCEPLRGLLAGLWSTLRPSLLGRRSVPPRIWYT